MSDFWLGFFHGKRGILPIANPSAEYAQGFSEAVDMYYDFV